MDNKINKYGLYIVLELLTSSQKYLDAYIEKYPDNESEALSFSVDPGCECKQKLITHYVENKKEVDQLTHEFISKNSTELNWVEFLKKYEATPVAGRFFKIDKTEKAYTDFVTRMHNERWSFRHMSVTTEESNYVIFFA